jgi:membrane protein implicated in regulation of membrane protease activity
MDVWVIWLVAAGVLGIGEMHQGGFYLAPFAAGAALAALLGLIGVGALLSAIVFLVASGIAFATLRPVARRHTRLPPSLRTGAAALIGRPAIVMERIANDEGMGSVKIDGGEVWTARSYDEHEVIPAGEHVEVVEIRGATALVMH